MTKVMRQDKILEILEKEKSVNIEDLARELNVSMVTLRRDISELYKKGLIEKFYGGIRSKRNSLSEARFFERMKLNQDKKEKIAELALKFITRDSTLFLDQSSTCYILAQKIAQKKEFLNIVTNNLYTALALAENPTHNIIVTGGTLDNKNWVTVGVISENMLKEVRVEKAFFSCSAFSFEEGAFDHAPQSANIKKIVGKNCKEVYMLVDSSKFGKKSIMKTFEIAEIDKFITDNFDENLYKIFKEKFVYAPSMGNS
jgi:DeoR/GlpR family transcriptional regulator of sugar metabolism